MIYDFKKIDKKWQKKWETEGTFFAKEDLYKAPNDVQNT